MKNSVLGLGFAVSAVLLGACTQTPGAPSVSFAAPVAAGPSSGSSFKFSQQPITLTLTNAVRTSPVAATYTVEVATDAGFLNVVHKQENIPEGEGGTTNVQLPQLGGNSVTTLYWRSLTNIDGIAGAASPARSFQIGARVVLQPPSQLSPDANSTAVDSRPTFRVANAAKEGPAGPVVYEFQVSTSSSFSPIAASATVPEQAGQTSWAPSVDLPVGNYFWRAQASDPSNDVKSGFTGARSFVLEPFSLRNAIIHNNPPDIGSWAETAKITWIDFTTYGRIVVDHSKRLGPGRWPDVHPKGWDGPLQYTLGMCLSISGKWHCSAAIQFWHERDLTEGGDVRLVWADWFYDSRWGEMAGRQPANGEMVGIFVVAGNVRDDPAVAVFERSNVQFVPYGTNFVLQ